MFEAWIDRAAELREEFSNAQPFPMLIIDNFLTEEAAAGLLSEFPAPDRMPKSRDYMFGEKRELSSLAEQGPVSRTFYESLMGDQFREFLTVLTGRPLFVDPAFHGGGFHQSGDGGFLDTHVDFNIHPLHPDWLRTLNILLYLNRDWETDYDGRLLLRTTPDEAPIGIEPLYNRGVIMVTSDRTYHGFRKMSLPPGVTRKSIATYAYEQVPKGSVTARTSGWAPENAGRVKRVIARHYDTLVATKTKFLGSGTAKNR